MTLFLIAYRIAYAIGLTPASLPKLEYIFAFVSASLTKSKLSCCKVFACSIEMCLKGDSSLFSIVILPLFLRRRFFVEVSGD